MRETVLLPCLWLLSTTGGSRHSVGGHINNRHSAWGRGNLICFPVFGVYLFVRGGPKSIAKLDGGMARCSPPLDPPLLPTGRVPRRLCAVFHMGHFCGAQY